jgi:hypothetical protein
MVGGNSPGDVSDNQQHSAAFSGAVDMRGNYKWEHQNPATCHV